MFFLPTGAKMRFKIKFKDQRSLGRMEKRAGGSLPREDWTGLKLNKNWIKMDFRRIRIEVTLGR